MKPIFTLRFRVPKVDENIVRRLMAATACRNSAKFGAYRRGQLLLRASGAQVVGEEWDLSIAFYRFRGRVDQTCDKVAVIDGKVERLIISSAYAFADFGALVRAIKRRRP